MLIPKCPDKPTITQTDSDTLRLPITLVTPMFGGGTETRKVDKDQPIRPTSIRGHLQFWWRATAGARHTQSQSLFADQADIWGSTSIKSKVSISVEAANNPPKFTFPDLPNNCGALKYALFPFSPQNGGPLGIKAEYKFTVTIKNVDRTLTKTQWDEVRNATIAWINFGGVGSRTRRGCGSLFSPNINLSSIQDIRTWLREKGSGNIRLWPTLPNVIYAKSDPIIHFNAWNDTVDMLRYFRQGDNKGRDHGNNPNQPLVLGQSRFPEPDTIRHLLNMWDHPPRNIYPQRGYPRAEFGLPIIFHFMGNGIPPDTTLQPVVNGKIQDRMASPLILKPLAISATNSIPCVLKMNTLPLEGVVLMRVNNEVPHSSSYPIRSSSFAAMNPSPMRGFSSAIDAFLKYAKDEGYTTN